MNRRFDWLGTLRMAIAVALTVILCALLVSRADAQTACTGSSTLAWTPPTLNTDGTPLTNLSGFRVYWGTGTTFSNSVVINNPGATSYIVDRLCAGIWFFAVTALTSAGNESGFSNRAMKPIQGSAGPNAPQVPLPTTVGGRVRTLLITTNSLVMPDVGTVPAGVPCDDTQQTVFNGAHYMRVNVSRVTADPGITLDAAWAVCR